MCAVVAAHAGYSSMWRLRVSVCAGSACGCSGNQADLGQEEGGLPASAVTFALIRSWPRDVLETSRGLSPAVSCGPIPWPQKQEKLVPLPLSFYKDGRGGFTKNRSFLLGMRLSPGGPPTQRPPPSSSDSQGAWDGHTSNSASGHVRPRSLFPDPPTAQRGHCGSGVGMLQEGRGLGL